MHGFDLTNGVAVAAKSIDVVGDGIRLNYRAKRGQEFHLLLLDWGDKKEFPDNPKIKKLLHDIGWIQSDELEKYVGKKKTREIFDKIMKKDGKIK